MDKRKDFFLIFKEAVNNLAKYSRATKALVKLSYQGSELKLMVIDNGVGFDAERISSGNGLKNMKTRAASLRGVFSVTSIPNEGTTVLLSFDPSHDDGIFIDSAKK
jgi:signal transduction histidine kinase